MIIALYLTRLILRGPPRPHVVLASFVVMSPLGQGGYSLLINGEVLYEVIPRHVGEGFLLSNFAGQTLYVGCFVGAWILWCMGLTWILISISSIFIVYRTEKIPFTLSYWGTVFPNGVFALCSIRLGTALHSPFFNYFGAIWSSKSDILSRSLRTWALTLVIVFVLILWIISFIPTITHLWDTSIFADNESQTMPYQPAQCRRSQQDISLAKES